MKGECSLPVFPPRAGVGKGRHLIAIYHDDPETTPETALRSDAGVLLDDDEAVPEGLEEVVIPAGRYAVVRHLGPYESLPATWVAVKSTFLTRAGRRRARRLRGCATGRERAGNPR